MKKSILWVDDHMENNALEINHLQKDGYRVFTVKSTRLALLLLNKTSFVPSIIISDMARQEGDTYWITAGLKLVRCLRSSRVRAPIFIYASPKAANQFSAQVREAGGNGITACPQELMQFIAHHAD
ncbi:MAG: hypothetical protein ACFCA4_04455 [Cyanophyceae cyanobacterium]